MDQNNKKTISFSDKGNVEAIKSYLMDYGEEVKRAALVKVGEESGWLVWRVERK